MSRGMGKQLQVTALLPLKPYAMGKCFSKGLDSNFIIHVKIIFSHSSSGINSTFFVVPGNFSNENFVPSKAAIRHYKHESSAERTRLLEYPHPLRPKFVEYTGITAGTYGCGACPGETEGTTCEKCTGSADTACNAVKETGEDFKCKNWELKDDKFVMKEAVTTCKRLKATGVKCNKSVQYHYNYSTNI